MFEADENHRLFRMILLICGFKYKIPTKQKAMNLFDKLKASEKSVATQNILKDKGTATLMQIKKDGLLKEHQSMTNALLILLSGKAVYEEKDRKIELEQVHDFVRIPAQVTHKVSGLQDSIFLLIQ